jgi:hypothetical protein
MRTSIASVALVASALAACNESLPPSPTPLATASPRVASLQGSEAARPFKGSCTTTFNPAPFPLPPIHHQTDVGTCQLTHLGRTEFYGEQDINFVAGTQTGSRRLTAANGDALYFTHVGTSSSVGQGQVRFTALATITGGTGRFAGATGSALVTGVATLATTSASFTLDGSISY